jgi:hypothetical protein
MPWTGARTFGRREWDEYRARHAQQLAVNPDYDRWWRRPLEGTSNAIFDHVAWERARPLADLIPHYKWLRDDDRASLARVAKQALAVALDAAVLAGERGRILTTNVIADALCARWSDNYRAALETTDALVSWDAPEPVMSAGLRDLHRNGLLFGTLLKAAVSGVDGLYKTERNYIKVRVKGGKGATRLLWRGFKVTLIPGQLLDDFLMLMKADPSYRRPVPGRRVLLSSATAYGDVIDEATERALSQGEFEGIIEHEGGLVTSPSRQVAAGRAYNASVVGPLGERVIKILESQRLLVYVPSVASDVTEWESALGQICGRCANPQDDKPHSDDPAHDHLRGMVNTHRPTRDQLKPCMEEVVEIQSRFRKWIRYYARDFWPTEVTTKETRIDEWSVGLLKKAETTHRGRWFEAREGDTRKPLAGFDIVRSQLQLLAVLLGDRELEAIAPRFKEVAANRARELFDLPADLTDRQLGAAIKQAVMTILYGSTPARAALVLRDDPRTYGPAGWMTPKMLVLLLNDPALHLRGVLKDFLPACQKVAEIAYAQDPAAGVVIPDPLDEGAYVRLNPVARRRRRVAGNGAYKIFANLPIGEASTGKYTGDFPVDPKELRRGVAPNFTHMLDSLASSLVILRAHALGVHPIVAIHDCWVTGYGSILLLGIAIRDANAPWLKMLGPMYDFFLRYFDDPKHGDKKKSEWARRIRSQWEARVAAEEWPSFVFSKAELVTLHVDAPWGEVILPRAEDDQKMGALRRALEAMQKELHEGAAPVP